MYSVQDVGKIIEAVEVKHASHNQLSHGRSGAAGHSGYLMKPGNTGGGGGAAPAPATATAQSSAKVKVEVRVPKESEGALRDLGVSKAQLSEAVSNISVKGNARVRFLGNHSDGDDWEVARIDVDINPAKIGQAGGMLEASIFHNQSTNQKYVQFNGGGYTADSGTTHDHVSGALAKLKKNVTDLGLDFKGSGPILEY